jgi:membrane associated rhomboid family serine protease
VLASQGIEADVEPGADGCRLVVAAGDAERALQAIEAFLRENHPPQAAHASTSSLVDGLHDRDPGATGLIVGLVLIGLHVAIGDRNLDHVAFDRGSADAYRIVNGEWWRAVTALCLHADLGHVIGNALFGLYFVTAVCRALGAGLGLGLIIASGAAGNLMNALSHGDFHDSVGFSTSVFGAVGILAGLALARRQRAGVRGRRLLLPIGAGLGLLAMLGTTGARVDVWAHLYGLIAGGGMGLAVALALQRAPSRPWQWLLGSASVASVALCWAWALR